MRSHPRALPYSILADLAARALGRVPLWPLVASLGLRPLRRRLQARFALVHWELAIPSSSAASLGSSGLDMLRPSPPSTQTKTHGAPDPHRRSPLGSGSHDQGTRYSGRHRDRDPRSLPLLPVDQRTTSHHRRRHPSVGACGVCLWPCRPPNLALASSYDSAHTTAP